MARLSREDLQDILFDPYAFLPLLTITSEEGKEFRFDNPHSEQIEILDALIKYNKIIIVKPRQIGASTVVRAFIFWMLYTCPDPIRALVVSHEHRSSKHLHYSVRNCYQSLLRLDPRFTRPIEIDNEDEFKFGDSKAVSNRLMIGATSQGKSFSFQVGHFTEVGSWHENKMANPDASWTSLQATLHPGPYFKSIVESTGHGPGNLFERLVREGLKAEEAGEGKVLLFPWSKHSKYWTKPPPGFEDHVTEEERALARVHNLNLGQIYWRRLQLQKGMSLKEFRHNYPLTIEDAFMSDSGSFFEVDLLNFQLAAANKRKPIEQKEGKFIYKRPVADHRYAMAVDSSSGIGEDWCAIQILDVDDYEQVAVYHTKTTKPERLGEIACEMGTAYNKALALAEKKGEQGGITLHTMKQLGYNNLWVDEEGNDWDTNPVSKRRAYTLLRQSTYQGLPILNHPATIQEVMSITEDRRGRICAPTGRHDDLADALAFAMVAMMTAEKMKPMSRVKQMLISRMMSKLPDHWAKRW